MRYIRIASAKNPLTDFIELNDFNGFLCTQFQTLGISSSIEFLPIKNRNIPVSNKTSFKKYSLVIEILTKYSEYETKYYDLLSFLDRNKKDGFRLYYKPYDDKEERYCLCSIETSSKTEKRQPIVLNLFQNSLWLSKVEIRNTSETEQAEGNIFAFSADDGDDGYYSASFSEDEDIPDYYCISFYTGIKQEADIEIKCYNEVPLNIIVYGRCANPHVLLYRKNENTPIKEFRVFHTIGEDFYLELKSGILENGVWEVEKSTGERRDLTELVDYSHGSPYFYLENGEYYVRVEDEGGNNVRADISWQEEYSE